MRLFLDESDYAVGRRLHRQLTPDLSAGVVKSTDNPASGPLQSTAGHRIVSRPDGRVASKELAKLAEGPELGERPSVEMSSIKALMELALPRFAMAEGPPSRPSAVAGQIEPHGGEDSCCSMDQTSLSSVYFNLDALTSSSNEESLDVKKGRTCR